MSVLNHAGMPHEHRLAQSYEEISAICRSAQMDRYASHDARVMAELVKKELQPVWEVICAMADERMAAEKAAKEVAS